MEPKLRLNPQALDWREVQGQIVVLAADDRALVVNRAGSVLWPLLAAGSDRRQLRARLMEAFRIDEARAEQDVDAFLQTLRERSLLEELTEESREA
jgi:streptomycin 6-kinase